MTESTIDAEAELLQLFGERLHSAREFVRAGSVRDVRLLQGGRVVTGVVAGNVVHRIYIQRPQSPRFTALEGECSCGESKLCVHIAAVSLAAAAVAERSESNTGRRADVVITPSSAVGASLRQAVYYLFEPLRDLKSAACELQVSVWVGHGRAGHAEFALENLQPFAARPAHGSDDYPRYVDASDKVILKSLLSLRAASPWRLAGSSGAAILQQAVATGRAFCGQFAGSPLRGSRTRHVDFAWELLPNGDQQLRPQVASSVQIVLSLDAVMYFDASVNLFGSIETSCPLDLLRTHVQGPPVTPMRIAALSDQIMREANGAAVPKLRAVTMRTQSYSSLAPKLILSAGPTATLHFLYNGLDVDSRLLSVEDAVARCISAEGDVCWEVPRDLEVEQRFLREFSATLESVGQRSEAWLAFMLQRAPALVAQGWTIVADDTFPYRIAVADHWYTDLSGADRDDWFDLRLGVTVSGEPINLLPALVSYLQGIAACGDVSYVRIDEHLMIRLPDGRYLPVPLGRIERIAHTLVELHEHRSLTETQAISLPLAQLSRIAQLTLDMDGPQVRAHDAGLGRLIEALRNFSGIEAIDAPAHFHAVLRSYQREGLGWLDFLSRYQLGGVLADDMGLGKTVQTLALLSRHKAEGRLHGPSLIVAPVSVIGNWHQEARRFAPELRVVVFHGPRRKELLRSIDAADVVITGYSLLQVDSEFMLDREFHYVILDEAQMIKNPRAKVAQVARALRARQRLCLTGTPMENHLGELWALFEFLQPGLLGDEREFQRRYRTPIEKNGDAKRAQALARRIAPFILRRTKEAVAPELPPKTQIVESLVLEDAQRDFYDGVRLAMHRRVLEVIQQQGLARSHITVLDALLKLRQACCDPRLVREDAETRNLPSAKLEWLRTVLPELVAEGRRVLLFSQFTSMLRLIEATVNELGIPYCLLTGETQQRAEVVARFQSGTVPLFLISLKAGGVGLNLTAADTVIHYDPWWNPAVEMQATDRAYRIGQDKPVFVYKLIAQGTVEEKILQLQAEKSALVGQLYTEQSATPSQWTVSDIEALFES